VKIKHIAVCGNIGSGKTTLVEKLSKHYGWNPLYESVDHNPYLKDFYEDMTRWAFNLQIYFLNSRFKQIRKIQESDRITIQDRTIYEDAYVFAENLHKSHYLSDRDYQSYVDIFNSMIRFVQPPDLLIYLRADIPKLVQQIQRRGRDFEYGIRLDYLKNLNEYYERWIDQYDQGKLITLDVNTHDFVARTEDFSSVVERIDLEINSLFTS